MPRRSKQQTTFADLVREAKIPAPEAAAQCQPGAHGDSSFVDQTGRRYQLTEPSIDAPTAQRAAAAGALIVWDPCGCGGYCGYQWLDPEQARKLGSVLPRIRNTKRRRGCIALYADDNGRELMLVEESVTWGSTIS